MTTRMNSEIVAARFLPRRWAASFQSEAPFSTATGALAVMALTPCLAILLVRLHGKVEGWQLLFGLLAILALQHVHSRDLVHVNIAKTALIAGSAVSSVTAFATAGVIVWDPALWLALGAGIGSFTAARFSLERGHGAIRAVVLGVCALLAIRLIAQHWPG